MTDWIPAREQDFADFCVRWDELLMDRDKCSEYGWDPDEAAEIGIAITCFLHAREAWLAENSTAKRLARDEAKKEVIRHMRSFANLSVRFNGRMDGPAKLEMGIRVRASSLIRHGQPASQPFTVLENTANHFENRIRALNREGQAKKPADAYGVRFVWQTGGERPLSAEDIRGKTRFSRKPVLVVGHSEAERGKPLYCATCYENSRGEAGPWSPIAEGIIS